MSTTQVRMVFGFSHPHPIGVICRAPCKYCREWEGNIGDIAFSDGIPTTDIPPLKIEGIATYQDYLLWCDANLTTGGIADAEGNYFYFVSTD